MKESISNAETWRRKNKHNRIIRWILTIMTAVSVLMLIFPVCRLQLDDSLFLLNGWKLIFAHLSFAGISIAIPITVRICVVLGLLTCLGGLFLLYRRKLEWAAALYIVSALSFLLLPMLLSPVTQTALQNGAEYVGLGMQIFYYLPFLFGIISAIASLWSRSGEKLAQAILLALACVSVGSVAFITLYMIIEGTPAIAKIGIVDFLFGTQWKPTADPPSFGILNMILASVLGTAGAIVIGVPIGLMTAVFLAEIAPKWLVRIVRPAVELLAGIPSVIYGFFGMQVIVPLIRKMFPDQTTGESLLAVIIILSIMILPTIISVAEGALRSVPVSYKEASLALGNTHIGTIFKVLIPAAKSGILAGVILGVGRAIGETMAIIMVAGNMVQSPSLLGATRPLTSGIAFEMGYATGLHREALFAIGLVLFVFIMIINITFTFISKKGAKMNEKE